ncbi:zinc finger CCCH domain-containing protein 24 isoform X2 [Abrus precatorius]|uniref:Zinc finger CCCH domain-containing protein 24 isoform X2 n=1 Tax=Abrus precatorius TaxID=3816 RepID=A0A8B8KWM0_ABRPR|nr:zinc finger CCCH domain-containing protein 24 isoform X2 [Abrus precatorius]
MAEPLTNPNTELASSKTLNPINVHDSTMEPHQTLPLDAQIHPQNDYVVPTKKRQRDDADADDDADRSVHPLWKTSLCSYFRRHGGSCSHGDACRYAHGEEELRPRPDNTWDQTSERAKKALKSETPEKRDVSEVVMMTEAVVDGDADGEDDGCGSSHALSKCLMHLPMKWSSEVLRNFLNKEGIAFKHAKKKKGMAVGFLTFEDEEQMKNSTKALEGKSISNKTLRVGDVIPRSFEKKSNSNVTLHQELDKENPMVDVPSSETLDAETNDDNLAFDGSVSKTRNVRDVVTPLAHMAYADQLEQKKNSLVKILKKLTKNARKACPTGVPLPEWVLKSREIGGLPCKLEGIVASPIVNGYRNKCEFSVGYSLEGKVTVGFMLGNFREGVTAVEEAVDCPNVSTIAGKYANIFQEFLQHSDLPVWNRFKNTGFWRQLTVREGRTNGSVVDAGTFDGIAEVMLIVQAFVAGATSHCPTLPLTALIVQDHQGISNVAPADAPMHPLPLPKTVGDPEMGENNNATDVRIHDYISNLQFSISPTAFFQVNTLAAEKLYSLAGDWACLGPDTLLFDICCGTGTIGLTLAHRVGMVIGIEMNASAVTDAHRNAEINGIKNVKFICAKAEDVMGSLLREYLDVTKEQVGHPNISGNGNDIPVDTACPEPENGEMASCCSDNNDAEVRNVVQKASTSEQVDGISKQAEDAMGAVLGENLNVPEEQVDDPNISKSGKDIPEDSANAEPENGEMASRCSENNSAEAGSVVQQDSASENGNTSSEQFKNVVAIVDPPRAGLHPTVIKALRTHPRLRRLVYISCNPESLVANAIELCTPSPIKVEKGNKDNRGWRNRSSAGLARHRAKSMPISEAFQPIKAIPVDLFPHTQHCELVMLLER